MGRSFRDGTLSIAPALYRPVGPGGRQDILIFDGGTEDSPGPQGYDATVIEDLPSLALRERTSDAWKRTDLLQAYDGTRYGVPVTGNAGNVGRLPEAIGAVPAPALAAPKRFG